jgi:hypothetical protein
MLLLLLRLRCISGILVQSWDSTSRFLVNTVDDMASSQIGASDVSSNFSPLLVRVGHDTVAAVLLSPTCAI